ncbi:type IV toxin-antitoxin system AbiEi family antitoxin domain-containing protein [Conexibacter sp. SYSU D00693]|uniref:type IV toxin-antitoxin system AbiEi family antitoxin domain-containing protein n=1 Tax=Conexibacter sp. SYSU D00693 TaxID=2812560 RepID=UPI00196A9BC8|nr:type IV toxin-antitoxin system AbiEi family antitoxin domain-containing protein [Conexibacter sp. SYSU D00693]
MFREPEVDRRRGGELQGRRREVAISALAGTQKGAVSRQQLAMLGLGDDAIASRLAAGRLIPLHRGVYLVGHRAMHPQAPWMAAVLAGGDGTVLSHRSCAGLRALLPVPSGDIDITVPDERGRGRAGLRVCVRELVPQDRDAVDGIPCTSVARTLLDLAERVRPSLLTAACEAAVREGLFDASAIAEVLDRCRGHRGARRLRIAVSELTDDPDVLRSELERRLKALLEGSALRQMPRFNRHADGASGTLWEVDALWRAQRLVVEADSWAFHGTRSARDRDANKQRDLEAAGWEVWRVTWKDVHAGRVALLRALDRRTRR